MQRYAVDTMRETAAIQILAGGSPEDELEPMLLRLCSLSVFKPFDQRAIDFIAALSQKILITPRIREFPELAALGHWFRKARLLKMAQSYRKGDRGSTQIGRGLVFHVAPSNVDSVFMYSWLISLLAGNTNLVRVSQKGGPQQDFLLEVLGELARLTEYKDVLARFVLLTYPHNDQITAQISEACMVRVIWGGDTTIRAIRALPLRPMATELCFADRFSAVALSAVEVIKADDAGFKKLIQGFYNDTFWFAQQACSSPRMVLWVGSELDVDLAKKRFWIALIREVQERNAENAPSMVMARIGAAFEFASYGLAGLSNQASLADFPLQMEVAPTSLSKVREIHCGNGLFVQMRVEALSELGQMLSDKDQTLAVYGFGEQEYLDLISTLPQRALDRIVPVGSALAFDPVWDGQNLITSFTRLITWPTRNEVDIRGVGIPSTSSTQ